jgi:hypothetical protein
MLEQYAFALSLNGDHVAQIDKENPSPDFDGYPKKLWLRKRLQPWECLHRPRRLFSRVACYDQGCTRMLRRAVNKKIASASWTRDCMSGWTHLQSVHRGVPDF